MNCDNEYVIIQIGLRSTIDSLKRNPTKASISANDVHELQARSHDYHANEVVNGSRWPKRASEKIKASWSKFAGNQSSLYKLSCSRSLPISTFYDLLSPSLTSICELRIGSHHQFYTAHARNGL